MTSPDFIPPGSETQAARSTRSSSTKAVTLTLASPKATLLARDRAMLDGERRARIRRLFYAEHWKVGTIATQLGIHRETLLLATEAQPRPHDQSRLLVKIEGDSYRLREAERQKKRSRVAK